MMFNISRAVLCSIAFCVAGVGSAPAMAQDGFECLSDAEKNAMMTEYARLTKSEGRAKADAYARAQGYAYGKKYPGGACPRRRVAATPEREPSPTRSARSDDGPSLFNRQGKPCRNIIMENRNVPNIGGSMGWAMFPVCAD